MTNTFNRRIFLRGAGLAGLSLAAGGLTLPHIARAATTQIKIVSNPGLENATLNALMEQQGYFKKFGVDVPPIARWFPSTGTFATNREWGYIRGYFRTRYDADAQGLKSWQYRDKPDTHEIDRGAVVTRL